MLLTTTIAVTARSSCRKPIIEGEPDVQTVSTVETTANRAIIIERQAVSVKKNDVVRATR